MNTRGSKKRKLVTHSSTINSYDKKSEKGSLTFEEAKEYLKNESPPPTGSGVYYNGGWEDEKNAKYSLNTYDGPSITKDIFRQLRDAGIIGGNQLVTYKARRFHPILAPGQKDTSKLGNLFYSESPFSLSDEDIDSDREFSISKDDNSASESDYEESDPKQRSVAKMHITWERVNGSNLPKQRVLCTNNIRGGTESMSHVWTARLIKKKEEVIGLDPIQLDGFSCASSDNSPVHDVDFWARLPVGLPRNAKLKLVEFKPCYVSTIYCD